MSESGSSPAAGGGTSRGENLWQLAAALLSLVIVAGPVGREPVLAAEVAASLGLLLVCVIRPFTGVLAVTGLTLGLDAIPVETGNEWVRLNPITARTHLFHSIAISSRVPWMPHLNALQVLLLVALLSWVIHHARGGTLRWRGGALHLPMGLLALAVVWGVLHGALRGGNWTMAMQETQALFHFILVYIAVALLLERPAQARALVWTVIGAVALRATVIWWNAGALLRFDLSYVDTVTGHEDALFLVSLLLLWALLRLYRTGRAQRLVLDALLVPILGAFIFTKRRVGLVALLLIVPYLPALLDWRRARRAIGAGLVGAALLSAYVAAFWNSESVVGLPVRMLQSVGQVRGDSRDASSNRYRIVEEMLLLIDVRGHAFRGKGFGHEYLTTWQSLADRPEGELGRGLFVGKDPTLRYITHNQVLWLWLKAGIPGLVAFFFLVAMVAAQGTRLARSLRNPYYRALALLAVCAMGVQVIASNFDMGLTGFRNLGYLGALLGLMVRLPDLDREEWAAKAPG